MPPKSTPMTQAAICRMIKESVDVAIVAERARKENVRNNASGSGPVRGLDTALAVCECTFAGFMKCNLIVFHGIEGAVELRRWFEKTESVFEISECVEDEAINDYRILSDRRSSKNGARIVKLALMCPRMVEPERVKVDAYIRGLMDNINDEVTSSKPANLNKAIHMAHKFMDQKLQASDARILEGKKRKWKSYQSGNSSGNTRAIVTAPTDGKLPLCERCFNRHVGQCTIKCHKCGKVGYKARYCKEKSVATGANAQPVWTCYDCREQGHSRKRCPKKVKQEEVGEVRG
ncbi:putative reverse transcriptase domain-containing protein [Tanacetum coccineum]